MNVVKIESGLISGTILGDAGKEVSVYRGIPYAGAAEGGLRWQPPRPVEPWTGIKECTAYGPAAPQEPPGPPFPQDLRGEDCLTLNVLTPAKSAAERLPVMVWLHGGGYVSGCANNQLYSALALPQRGVILVGVNHRLGLMGLMAHPLLSKEAKNHVSGNYMFLDIIASLKWVKRNIGAFGGNPNNITIFGESGGGGKVACLMASPLAKGLFHRAVCESGTAVNAPFFGGVPLEELEKKGEQFFAHLGVAKEKDPLKAARAMPWQKLLEAEKTFAQKSGESEMMALLRLWDACIDGWFLEDSPGNVFKEGKHNAVPLITGANLAELYEGMVVMPWVVPAYVAQMDWNNRVGSKSWAYIFDHTAAGWKKAGMKATHGMELNYVFGLPEKDWATVMPGARLPEPALDAADAKVAEAMQAMWVQFAKTGSPGVKGLVDWPAYDTASDRYIYIDEPLQVKNGFSKLVTEEDLKKRMI